jgi:hypothetical protein
MSGHIVGWTAPHFSHECEPPDTSEGVEDFKIGTVWQCDCGKTHIVYAVVVHLVTNRSYLSWTREGRGPRRRREKRDAPRRTTGGYPSSSKPTSQLKPPPASICRPKSQMEEPPLDTSWITMREQGPL